MKITINGREVESAPGRLLIDLAEEHDIFIPRFCYHPALESVAACRMCLVEIEGGRRPLEPACTTPVADGMSVRTDSPIAREAQESVLEFLLINHPLDCPICDRGGECPLQDQTLRFGPGRSRYLEEKRHFEKPIPISNLVMLDRERCVLCWRCVRFCDEVSGDRFIDLLDRGSLTQVNIADRTFDSYFSGNTIQICPVGALTATSYRFLSRPWDLTSAPTTCSFCSVGCPISLEQRGGEVMRAQALPNEHVNSFWNCDKGRFGHRYVSHPERLEAPLIRHRLGGGKAEFVETSWDSALDIVAARIRAALEAHGPGAVGFIGGSHLTNEDLYAASRFFREVVGAPNLDFRTFDAGFPYDALARDGIAGSDAVLDDLDHAAAILWFGADPREELPVLYLRLRRAVARGARLIVAHPRRISLSGMGIDLRYPPGRAAGLMEALAGGDGDCGVDPALIGAAREAMDGGPVVVCAGQQFVGQTWGDALSALRSVIEAFGEVKVLLCVPNANSQGALDMGVWPTRGPGHVPVEKAGLDTGGMLRAASAGRLGFLWICGADLATDYPEAAVVEAALASDAFVVVSELFPTSTARSADVILPAASFAEKEGSFTNLERRIQKVNPAVPPPGIARADWQIFQDLTRRFGADWGWGSSADVAAEIAERVPTHAGFSWEALGEPAPALVRTTDAPAAGGAWKTIFRSGGSEPRPAEGAWPLSWELRAVDATRRRGWVWGDDGSPEASGPGRALREPPPGVAQRAAAPVGPGESPRARPSASPGPSPAQTGSEAFPLLLLLGRILYDGGAMVTRSPELRNVTPEPFVELHPEESAARGLADGDEVTVASARGSVVVRLRVSEDTPSKAAFMPFDHPRVRANALVTGPATFVEVSR